MKSPAGAVQRRRGPRRRRGVHPRRRRALRQPTPTRPAGPLLQRTRASCRSSGPGSVHAAYAARACGPAAPPARARAGQRAGDRVLAEARRPRAAATRSPRRRPSPRRTAAPQLHPGRRRLRGDRALRRGRRADAHRGGRLPARRRPGAGGHHASATAARTTSGRCSSPATTVWIGDVPGLREALADADEPGAEYLQPAPDAPDDEDGAAADRRAARASLLEPLGPTRPTTRGPSSGADYTWQGQRSIDSRLTSLFGLPRRAHRRRRGRRRPAAAVRHPAGRTAPST